MSVSLIESKMNVNVHCCVTHLTEPAFSATGGSHPAGSMVPWNM